MAELSIGQHCNVFECKQLDFLPLACNLCEKVFCKQHASYDEHSCPGLAKLIADRSISSTSHAQLLFKCDFSGCSHRELVEIRCNSCGASYCLVHRHGTDHRCPSLVPAADPLQKTSELIKELVQTSQRSSTSSTANAKPKVFKDPKSVAMASKIALIKLKQKAIGDTSIPDADRVFFDVLLPLGSQQKRLSMYFSRHWCVGKAIDKVASSARLMHSNGEAGLLRSLHMFDGNVGLICPSDLTVGALVDNAAADRCVVLHNGSTVIVEYTDETVEQISTENYTK